MFQSHPDRVLSLLDAPPTDAGGYSFSAPALKQREHRLDGLFLPPPERSDLPALILEAQMGPDPGFLRRLYAESARLLPQAVSELKCNVPAARAIEDGAELLTLIPAILLARFNDRPIQEICAMAGLTVDDFTQSVAYREIFGLGETRGQAKGREEGRQVEAASVTLRLLNRRCGPLSEATRARIQALPLERLEDLAEALLDFQGPADLGAWLAAKT